MHISTLMVQKLMMKKLMIITPIWEMLSRRIWTFSKVWQIYFALMLAILIFSQYMLDLKKKKEIDQKD